MTEPHRHRAERTDAVRNAIASVTAWLLDDAELGRALGAEAFDHDPVGYLDAMGGLWVVVHDVAAESQVDIGAIIRDIAVGVAQAAAEDER